MADDAIDARLTTLLGAPDPAPDPAFVARVARVVEADRVFRNARRRAWRRFGTEALATTGIAAGAMLVWRGRLLAATTDTLTLGPAAVLPLMLLLWLAVGMRPAAR